MSRSPPAGKSYTRRDRARGKVLVVQDHDVGGSADPQVAPVELEDVGDLTG